MIDRIPNSYAERAFMGRNEEAKVRKINTVAEQINRRILNPIDDVARRNVNNQSVILIEGLKGLGEWQASSVNDLVETAKDPNRSVNRMIAEERLDVLAKATYIAMRYGENGEAIDAIQGGSVEQMMELLPEAMKNKEFVQRVRDLEITTPEIREILDKLDKRGRVFKAAGEGGKKGLKNNLEVAIEKLACLDDLDSKGDEEIMRVSAYLGVEVEKMGEEKVDRRRREEEPSNSSVMEEYMRRNVEYAKASAEYARSRGILEQQVQQVSLEEILDSYLKIKAPRERAPQMWEYEVPSFMNGMNQEKWRKLLNFQDAWLGAIYNKRADSAYNNSLEKMKDGILSMRSLAEGDFKTWYEDETLNLRGVMHQISRDLLTEKTVTQGGETRKIYAFETRINPRTNREEYIQGSRVQEFADNEDIYKLNLVKRLVENNIVGNEEAAKLAVALSMDIMEMGGVFSVADGLRKLSWESDAVRLAQRPERKFTSKVGGGELFAGPWTELANTLSQGDPKRAVEMVKSWGVVPELLSGSFLDQRLDLGGGRKTDKTMMEMIYQDEKIPFRDLENDLFFGWRKDHVMPAARTWLYISNKIPLEFSRNRENDTVISQWRTDLFNDINQLRKNEDSLLPTSIVAGAIGGSVGLWPFNGPYLRINEADTAMKYSSEAIEILRQLGLENEERNKIYDFFGIDRKYFKDFNLKYVSYGIFRNRTIREKVRDTALKDMLRPRK